MKTETTTSVQLTVGQLYLFPGTVVIVFQTSMLSILGMGLISMKDALNTL